MKQKNVFKKIFSDQDSIPKRFIVGKILLYSVKNELFDIFTNKDEWFKMNIEADAYSDTKSVYNSKAVASWNAGNVTKTANMPGSTGDTACL